MPKLEYLNVNDIRVTVTHSITCIQCGHVYAKFKDEISPSDFIFTATRNGFILVDGEPHCLNCTNEIIDNIPRPGEP